MSLVPLLVTTPWWETVAGSGAVAAADFTSGKYMKNGVEVSQSTWINCSRLSAGTAQKVDGTIVNFTNNQPRITDRGLLVENSKSNLIVYGCDFTQANWVKFGTVTVTPNSVTAPDGTLTADTITIAAASGIYQTVTAAASSTYTDSIWLRTDTTSTVRLVADTNLSDPQTLTLNLTSAWQRFSLSRNTSVGTTQINLQLDTSSGGNIYAWGGQIEAQGDLSSTIITTTTAVTRAADDLYTLLSGMSNFGAMYCEFEIPNFGSTTSGYGAAGSLVIDGDSVNNRWSIWVSDGGLDDIQAGGVTVGSSVAQISLSSSSPSSSGNIYKAFMSFAKDNTVAVQSSWASANDTLCDTITPNKLMLGQLGTTGNYLRAYLRKIIVYAKTKTSSEMTTAVVPSTRPSLDLDFINQTYYVKNGFTSFDNIITCTRASTGTALSSTGVLTSFSANVPKLTDLGLWSEEARTNSVRNNTMVGAAAGSPGTAPSSGWSIPTTADGLNLTIVGTGTDNGINYIDVRYNGTTTGTGGADIYFESGTSIVASSGQVWAASAFLKCVAGTMPAGIHRMDIRAYSSVPALINGAFTGVTIRTSGNLGLNRVFTTYTMPASTAYVRPNIHIDWASGVAVDFTLRIGMPQIENCGSSMVGPTMPIATSGATATRAADLLKVNMFRDWINMVEGSVIIQAVVPPVWNASTAVFYCISDGTFNNSIYSQQAGAGTVVAPTTIVGGAAQASMAGNSAAVNTTFKNAASYRTNAFYAYQNNVSGGSDGLGTIPVTSQCYLGSTGWNSGTSSNWCNSPIKTFRYIPYSSNMNLTQLQSWSN